LTPLPHRLVRSGPLPTLARTRLERRGALWVEVEAEGARLQVINTHLGLLPLEQRRQTLDLLGEAWLGAPECRAPAALLGDFNATSRYAAYRRLATRLRDVQLGPGNVRRGRRPVRTFPSRLPVIRIDHMFLTPDIEVLSVHTPDHALARVASDHLPLVADLRLRAADAGQTRMSASSPPSAPT
jgi:endonuclease/exonuclease/phosphatase family metal-dependent hydrolase